METKSVAFFHNGLGNFVEFTPALQAIASMDESGKVDLCTDQVWTDHRKDALLDMCLLLPFINRVVVLEDAAKIKYKVWFWTPWACHADLFQKRKNYPAPGWSQRKQHETDYYMDIARKFYGYKGEKPRQAVVPASEPVIDKKGKKLVVFCNGGFGQLSVFKRWDGFKRIAQALKQFFPDVITVKIGIKHELDGVDTDLDFLDKLKITQTAKVIQQADLIITTDTCNMHIADALGVPMIVLWGGSHLAKNRPYEAKNVVVHLGLKCQPCVNIANYRFCKDFRCIRGIEVGEVMHHIRNFFKKGTFDDTKLGAIANS